MIFKNFIDNNILEYPILFLRSTYEKSEMMVLNHVFFVVGNGFHFKKGYPLAYGDDNDKLKIKTYKEKDMTSFFDKLHEFWYLDYNLPTRKFISDFNIKIPEIKEYSNNRYIYILDEEFVKKFNKKVDKYQGCNPSDEIAVVRKFHKLDEMLFINEVLFYPISMDHSKIAQITKHKRQNETDEYALKLLDYAENFYHNYPQKNKDYDIKSEIKKIQKLRSEIKK